MIILLFGPPGAGKGTQSAMLVSKKGMNHISTGDLFRNAIKKETPLGLKAKSFMDQGQLVPDDVTIGLVDEIFDQYAGKDIILDGFPRTLPQADALQALLDKKALKLDKAVFIEVPEEDLLARLCGRRVCSSCGASFHMEFKMPKKEGICDDCGGDLKQRPDDTEEAIKVRLGAYKDSTYPLVEYYKGKGSFVEISGTGSTEDVFERISKVLV